MRLHDLEATFLRFEKRREMATFRKEDGTDEEREIDRHIHVEVPTLAEADGVEFLCPLCNCAHEMRRLVVAIGCGIEHHDVVPEGPPLFFRPGIGALEQRHDILLEPAVIVDDECRSCFHGGVLSLPIKSALWACPRGSVVTVSGRLASPPV
jgi:hypothetical protein